MTNRIALAYDLYKEVDKQYGKSVSWHWGYTLDTVDFDGW